LVNILDILRNLGYFSQFGDKLATDKDDKVLPNVTRK